MSIFLRIMPKLVNFYMKAINIVLYLIIFKHCIINYPSTKIMSFKKHIAGKIWTALTGGKQKTTGTEVITLRNKYFL